MADRIEAVFSLNNRPTRAENNSDRHHAFSCHCFRDVRLQFTLVRPICTNCFFFNFFIVVYRSECRILHS